MNKKAKILKTALFLGIVIMAIGFLVPDLCFAQEEALTVVGEEAGVETGEPLPVLIGKIIRIFLSILGVVFLLIFIYAGYLWMTAGGEAEKVEKAKKWMTNAVIGLVICLFAFSIVTFIINRLMEEVFEQPAPSYYAGYGSGGSGYGGGALGNGVIEDHYPPRDAKNMPRNVFIMVKFYEPLKIESVMDNAESCGDLGDQWCGGINYANIRIFKTEDAEEDGAPPSDVNKLVTKGEMGLTADKKIFFFRPFCTPDDTSECLGSSTTETDYSVYLTSGIQGEDGSGIFGEFNDYAWIFEVGTYLDLTPPKVTSVYPMPPENDPNQEFFANSIIQINFNEAVLPPSVTTTSGESPDKNNSIYIAYDKEIEEKFVAGTFNVGLNQFKTIEFVPLEDCGEGITNSCGETPKCLPRNSAIEPYLKSASVNSEGLTNFPFNGLVDTAGNSLDGNEDGVAQGPTEDDYTWLFRTSADLDLIPPAILNDVNALRPTLAEGEVQPDAQVAAFFTEGLSASYVNSKTAGITGDNWAKWYVSHLLNEIVDVDENGQEYTETNNTAIDITHGDFDKAPEPPPGEPENPFKYYPTMTSAIRDLQQNCFYPASGPGCTDTSGSCCPDEAGTQGATTDPSCGYY